jgi:hypothetical protein
MSSAGDTTIVPNSSALDPLTLAAMSSAVGDCLGPFVSRAIDCGAHWLSDRYKGHPKLAIETTQRNAVNFYRQVTMCPNGLQQAEGFEEKKEQALADPDYTSLLQEAVLGAARTSSEQKHKLLAHLVTDRLTAEPDSLRNLAAHMACNAVPQLSNMHLKLLGLLYIIRHEPAPSYLDDLPDDIRIDARAKWFLAEITPFLPIGELTDLDFSHLTAVSCITCVPQRFPTLAGFNEDPAYWNLSVLVHNKLDPREDHGHLWIQIEDDQNWKDLFSVWNNSNMRKASLTPAGSLICMHVRDTIICTTCASRYN